MNAEPEGAYVYQPMPPQEDGRFYAVGGLHIFGIHEDEARLVGITITDAEEVVRLVKLTQPLRQALFAH